MICLSGKSDYSEEFRAYALIKPETVESPRYVFFGFPHQVGDRFMLWNGFPNKAQRSHDECLAAFHVVLDRHIDAYGYKLVDADTKIVSEAAWTCDLDELSICYEGAETTEEYVIREWLEHHIIDLSTKHLFLALLAKEDRELDDPQLLDQIKKQMDENG